VSARARTLLVVGVLALGAVAVVVGVAAVSGGEPKPKAQPAPKPPPGVPPLVLDLGVRTDPEAVALRRAAGLYQRGKRPQAAAIFARYRSPEAKVGSALAAWPHGSLDRLQQLAGFYPRSGAVQLNLGFARVWAAQPGAVTAWQQAAKVEPDSVYRITADDLLYRAFTRGVPVFVPGFEPPAAITRLSAAAQLAALRKAAGSGAVRDLLLYGVALQRLGRPVSAERAYAAAAARAPGDDEAQVARAVGLFDKAVPAKAFSQLGPLTRRFPRSASVRFHLGLLLLWSGQIPQGKRQLRLAVSVAPGSPLADEAATYLKRLGKIGTH